MQQARSLVSAEFEAVNQLIIEQLESRVPLVENIGHYIVDAGGKRLRPLLTLLSGGACGQLKEQHQTLAAIVEFIHTATLLHDDVVDLSELRRGRPTANAQWGNAPSVLVGDFLYSRAFQLMVRLGNQDIMALMADTTNTIAEGEVLQLTKAGDPETTEAAYYEVIKSKTAVLFAAACAGGAILIEDCPHRAALEQYGLELGMAFQLVDDALDYLGNSEEMGKNVGDDLNEGKPTLPLIYTMANADAASASLVRTAICEKSADALEDIVEAVIRCGAIDYTLEEARRASARACQALAALPDTLHKEALCAIAEQATSRRS